MTIQILSKLVNKHKIGRQIRYMKYLFDQKIGAKVDLALSCDGNRGSIGYCDLFKDLKRFIGIKNM